MEKCHMADVGMRAFREQFTLSTTYARGKITDTLSGGSLAIFRQITFLVFFSEKLYYFSVINEIVITSLKKNVLSKSDCCLFPLHVVDLK